MNLKGRHFLTSESVTEGHPDKVCDQISDAILDDILKDEPAARVACETFISRGMIMSGEMRRLIAEDGVRGMTSNPAIFEKAISGCTEYAGALRHLAVSGRSPVEIYEAIAIQDIQWAADVLAGTAEKSHPLLQAPALRATHGVAPRCTRIAMLPRLREPLEATRRSSGSGIRLGTLR